MASTLTIALTLLVRAAWLARFPTHPIAPIDAEGFHLLAVNWLDGRGFAIGWELPFCPTAVRTPLYPLFLAGIYAVLGRDPLRVLPVHLLLEALTTALVIRLGRDLGGKRLGLWAGLLYAGNGTTQRYTGYLLSETLLLPLLTAAVWMTLRFLRHPTIKKAVYTGCLWGLTLLTKPNVQFLALGVGGLVIWRMVNQRIGESANERISGSANQRISGSANQRISKPARFSSLPLSPCPLPPFPFLFFWLTLGLILGPWLLRNRLVFDRWMLSTAFEENLARVSMVATLAEMEGVRIEPWTETWEYYYKRVAADAGLCERWDECSVLQGDCPEQQRRQATMARAAREIVKTHWRSYLRAHLRGVLTSLRDPGHRLWYHVLTGRDWESTGVIADMGARIAWSLKKGALGDALHALWMERVARPPLLAAALWWGLATARVVMWIFTLRGAWRLRRRPWTLAVLSGTVAYLLLLPGPIAHDRFYLPAIPEVILLALTGWGKPVRDDETVARECPRCWCAI